MNPNNLKKLARVTGRHGLVFGKWMLIACLTGLVVGGVQQPIRPMHDLGYGDLYG